LLVPAVATPAEAPVAAAGIPAPPVEPALEVTFQGRVLDPGGKPVAGARLFSYQKPAGAAPSNSQLDLAQRAVTDTGGQFRFTAPRILLERPGNQTDLLPVLAVADGFGIAWALLPKPDEDLTFRLAPDQPIVGRILDTEGRPVADCTVEVREVIRYRLGRLDGFLAGWRADWRDAMYADMEAGLDHPPASMMPVTGPDRDGRFRISGVGAERQVILDVKAPGLAQGVLFVMTRPDFDPGPTNRAVLERSLHLPGPLPVLYGPTLNYVATPAKPIVGRVREAVSGRPIAGANVGAGIAYSSGVSATTDSGGRFHLDGMPKQKDYSLFVRPPSGSPLIGRLIRFVDTEGLQPLTADVELVRGSIISGRIIDRSNGRGVSSNIHFYSLPDESVAGKTGIGRDRQSDFGTTTGPDGRFRLPVVAGPGVLTVRADGREVLDTQTIDPFLPALLDAQERKRARVTIHGDTSYFVTTADGAMRPITANIVKLLNPSAGAESEPMELFVERGRTVAVRIEDPDGRPLTGTIVSGMTAMWPITFTLPSAECTLYALDPRKPRMVVFYHPERKLVGVLRARGDEAAPLTVRLLPTGGTVTGRVLDSAGEPVAGAGVMQHYSEDESARELFRYLSARGRRGVRTQTGADGSFRFDEVLPDLRFDLGFKKGATTLAGPAGNLWFGPHRVAGGKALDLGDLRTKPRGE
jgi:protocatechuate 3,4-dioxygenase beta subunit